MSQEKVERHKKEKANRKSILRKEKAKRAALRTLGTIACIALVGWIGYSGYLQWEAKRPVKTTEITMDSLSNYLNNLGAEENAQDAAE